MVDYQETIVSVKNFVDKNLSVDMSLDGTSSSPRTRRTLQHMASIKHPLGGHAQMLYESVLQHALTCEKQCPGSGVLFLKKFCNHRRDDLVSHRMTTKTEVIQLLQSSGISENIIAMLETALQYCGTGTRLSIKKSVSEKTYIEIVEGYSFSVKPLIRVPLVELKNIKVLCIDGYLESVSEIHHLLTHLSETKDPCLMFVRGASEDILHTLKVNNDRRTILVYPFLVPFDTDNVNTIVDIAVVSGTDIISSLKGNLISSIDQTNLATVESCLISGDTVRLRNNKTRRRVKEHFDQIRSKLEERVEIEEILSKRMRSLTASCIDLCIPDDINYLSKSQQLDEGIRLISSIMNNTYDPSVITDRMLQSFHSTYANCLL